MNEYGYSTNKDPNVFLKHILESIEWIEKDINDLTEDQFMENIPTHGYFGVDFKIVWDTANKTLPEFKKQIESLLRLV